MNEQLKNWLTAAGVNIESLVESNTHFIYLVVDPSTGEFTKFGQGPINMIIRALEVDSENSMLADIIKRQDITTMKKANGSLSFEHEGDIHMFVPL